MLWNELDIDARKSLSGLISAHHDVSLLTLDLLEKQYDELPELWQNLIFGYYEKVIESQRGKQQIKFDHRIEEQLPSEYSCPRCSAPMTQVQDKRGIHWKCKNCEWDSERPWDFSKEKREFEINRCAQILKDMFPEFNIVGNFPYSPDAVLTGAFDEGTTNYDLGVYYFGQKLARIRVELNQHLTQKQFMETDHDIYVIGRRAIVEKLAERDGLVCHHLLDEPKKPVGMSRLKVVRDNCPQKTDRFGNIQYAIPKDKRSLIVTFDKDEIEFLLTQKYYRINKRNMVIK